MATDLTINGLATLVTSLSSADLLMGWRASQGDTVKITKANLLGAIFTGSTPGTYVNNGFTATIPGTGTVAMRGLTNTFSLRQIFGQGINFGQSDDLDYYDLNVWTPNIRDNVSPSGGVAATVGTTLATYIAIGDICFVWGAFVNITTTGMTAGNTVHFHGLPFVSKTGYVTVSPARTENVTFTNPPIATVGAGVQYATLDASVSGGARQPTIVSHLTSGTADIWINLAYPIA